MKPSNIGGQAVMEGIMMRHKDKYAVAVRRPDKEIELKVEDYKCTFGKAAFWKSRSSGSSQLCGRSCSRNQMSYVFG